MNEEIEKSPDGAEPNVLKKLPEWERPGNVGVIERKNADGTVEKIAYGEPRPDVRFEVRTPNAGFHGERAGVTFKEGVGFTDSEAAAHDCRGFGYRVIDHQHGKDKGTRGQGDGANVPKKA